MEPRAIKLLEDAVRGAGMSKSFQMLKVIEMAMLCQFDHPSVWRCLEEQLLYSCEYESIRDIIEVLETVKISPHFRSDNFWQRMMEKIVKMHMQLNCRDIIDIVSLYNQRPEMSSYIRNHSKGFIVEEIDSLTNKEVLTLLELFKDDYEFRRFLAHSLKEKITLSNSMPLKELMTSLVVTLDLPEVRGDIVRYALNSEVFYAFPVAYLISILGKLQDISRYQYPPQSSLSGRVPRSGLTLADEDIRDLMKTL